MLLSDPGRPNTFQSWCGAKNQLRGGQEGRKHYRLWSTFPTEEEVITLADLTLAQCWNELCGYLKLDCICPAIKLMIMEYLYSQKLPLMEYNGHCDYDGKICSVII